jgi:ferredoxin
MKSKKLRDSAKDQDCQVWLPGVCNGDSSTVVLAHLNGAGIAMKSSDIHGAYACSACHAWLDHGYAKDYTRDQRDLAHLRAVIRTQKIMLQEGLINVK